MVQKRLEESENLDLDELLRAWVEYGACVRMEHGEKHPQLVRTHFYLATTYRERRAHFTPSRLRGCSLLITVCSAVRQKLVAQALQHFKTADSVNTQIGSKDPDSQNFHCRILEGMGICETRLGHFAAAQSLLDKASKMCSIPATEGEGDDEGEVDLSDGRAASVQVALSELYSAQGKFVESVDCLVKAWECKENELGEEHPQVGQLFNAMGTVKQKHLKELEQLLADVEVILESSIRVKQQIDEKTEGLHLQGAQEQRGVQELIEDIANYRQKQRDLQQEVHVCKADALDYMNRARKIITKAKGAVHQDSVALTKTVSVLALRFAEEEKEAIKAKNSASVTEVSPARKAAEEKTKDWLTKQGENLEIFGLAGNAHQDGVESLISVLRLKPAPPQPDMAV